MALVTPKADAEDEFPFCGPPAPSPSSLAAQAPQKKECMFFFRTPPLSILTLFSDFPCVLAAPIYLGTGFPPHQVCSRVIESSYLFHRHLNPHPLPSPIKLNVASFNGSPPLFAFDPIFLFLETYRSPPLTVVQYRASEPFGVLPGTGFTPFFPSSFAGHLWFVKIAPPRDWCQGLILHKRDGRSGL